MRLETRLAQAGGIGAPPLDRSTIWPYRDATPGDPFYARFGGPTVYAAEQALGELDGGTALLFASGAGAVTSVLLGLLEAGRRVALADGIYYGTSGLLDELGRFGLEYELFDQTGPPPDG